MCSRGPLGELCGPERAARELREAGALSGVCADGAQESEFEELLLVHRALDRMRDERDAVPAPLAPPRPAPPRPFSSFSFSFSFAAAAGCEAPAAASGARALTRGCWDAALGTAAGADGAGGAGCIACPRCPRTPVQLY